MKIFKLFFVCSFLFSAISLSADNCDTCNTSDTCEILYSDWTFEADWLYWKARKCNLDYVGINDLPSSFVGKPSDVDLDYDHGFRLALFKCCDCFSFGIRYYDYSTSESDTTTKGNLAMSATRMNSKFFFRMQPGDMKFARAKYDLDFNMIDLEVSRNLVFCNNFFMIFGGLKIAFIDQEMDTLYSEDIDNPRGDDFVTVKECNDMQAYGLYIGTEGTWDYCDCFSFFGRLSFGSLLASFDRKFIEDSFEVANKFNDVDYKINDKCFVYNFEYSLGIEYMICNLFCNDFLIRFGYEFNTFFGMEDFINFVDAQIPTKTSRNNDTLGFDGFFLRLIYEF